MNGRGQTEFDYVVGMTLVLLTLTGVFTFVPGIYEPFDDPVSEDERALADDIAEDVLEGSTVNGTENTVEMSVLQANIQSVTVPSGVGGYNVTLHNESGVVSGMGAGSSYADNREPAATTVRIVTLANDRSGTCDPVCRLIVRVW